MERHKEKELLSENDLEREARTNDHIRRERLKNVVNIFTIVLLLIVLVLGSGVWIYLIYLYFKTGNLEKIETIAFSVIAFIAGYIVKYLQETGVIGK